MSPAAACTVCCLLAMFLQPRLGSPQPSASLSSLLRLILVLPLLALPSPAAAQGYRNVSLGSSLTTQGTSSWLSPSGDFAFGFLPVIPGATDNFLLAVWFAKIPDKTRVWFLRKDGATPLLRAGSRVNLTGDGLLVLTDHTGNTSWTAANVPASYAAMLDSGNFVLVSSGGGYRWQSFANPTDTILPTQQLPLGTNLVARLMDTDYTNGRFKLALQANGNLVLYSIPLGNGNQYKPYWSSKTVSADVTNLIFDTSGNVYLTYRNGTIASNVTSGNGPTSEFNQRATLEPNGLFRHYRYPKNSTAGTEWTLTQQIPNDICRDLLTEVGSGACGYNALCVTVNKTPKCSCPEGYSNEVQIAVKKLDKVGLKENQAEKEFMTEVKAIGLTHHRNLVRLLGYCGEGSHRMLVYEFLSNGSLTTFLFGGSGGVGLGWVQRTKIACGIARGLFYLHEECAKQIIHCDIKPQNVLLDEQLNPKISDFGVAKPLGSDQTRTATGIRGTRGYVAPEWFRPVHVGVTAKVDVYSFGVMLLEIVCCKRAIEHVSQEDSGEPEAEILMYRVYDFYKEGRVDLLVGDDLEAMADMNRVQRFLMVALWCIQDDPVLRPTMKKVTQMLEGEIEVSVPPDPSTFSSSAT